MVCRPVKSLVTTRLRVMSRVSFLSITANSSMLHFQESTEEPLERPPSFKFTLCVLTKLFM